MNILVASPKADLLLIRKQTKPLGSQGAKQYPRRPILDLIYTDILQRLF